MKLFKPFYKLSLFAALLFAGLSAYAQETREELVAKAALLRAQIEATKTEASNLLAQRANLLSMVDTLEIQVKEVDDKIAALPPPAGEVLRYWYTSDDGDGPSRTAWSRHLKILWKNPDSGDFLDANGTPQGTAPFSVVTTTKLGPVSIPIENIQAVRKGILLKMTGKNHPYASFAGRLSNTPPTLVVKLKSGKEETISVLSFAAWTTTSFAGLDTRQSARASSTNSVMALFDIPADAVSGTLNLNLIARNNYPGTLSVFALNPPGVMYPHEHKPVPGIAQTVADEEALKKHPSVIRAGDFDLRKSNKEGGTFDGIQQAPHVTKEYLPDPLDPSRIIYRSMFKQRDGTASGDQNWRGSLTLTIGTMRADTSDPMFPIAGPPTKELFGRMCFQMEDNWKSRNDGNKMALGWDLRFGYWTGTYWQQTTGNGGARGTGLKVLRTNKNGSKQWEYQGHSIRMESGTGPKDPNHPQDGLRPIISYTYHLDQFDFNGTNERWGNAVIERGRYHCIEQQIKINSIVGPFDELGNGQAVADGVLRTWVDGVFVGERTDMRWHRHPSMGVEGPWINWFFGGKQAAEYQMNYKMFDMVLATEYIGLPRNFYQRNK